MIGRLLRAPATRILAAAVAVAVPSMVAYKVHCDSAAASAPPSPLSGDEFRKFRVQSVEQLTHNTRKISLELPAESSLGIRTASALLVRTKIGEEEVIRPYTPTTLGDVKGRFDFVIKVYPEGKVSKAMGAVQVGDSVDVKGPIAKLAVTPNMKKQIAMVAGGTGITPMYQVLQEITRNPEDKTQVTLIYANHTPNDIILKPELDAIAAAHPNVAIKYVVSTGDASWTGTTGRINKELLAASLPAPAAGEEIMVLVCGPLSFMKDISGTKNMKDYSQGELAGALKELGYVEAQVYKF
eukprot:a953_284.p1 GENE.a953_284~~a953_284.p1  ORF type:complete len:307 (-),score=133.86 a953_284:74-964(-)